MERRNILIVTYYWPPASSGGVWRFLKVSKYLQHFGWNPIILTVKNGTFAAIDESLTAEVSDQTKVYKSKALEPFRIYNMLSRKKDKVVSEAMSNIAESKNIFQKLSKYVRANLFIPDARVGWVPYAVRKARSIIEKENVSLIVTTGPPHSTHLIGRKLKKRYKIPWVMDFRDPWTSNYLIREILQRSKRAESIDLSLETKCLKEADALVCISKGMLEEYRNRVRVSKVIYNGFDPEDFPKAEVDDKDEFFTLSYIGSMKPNQNIEALWKALHELRIENAKFKKYFRLKFVGNLNSHILQSISDLGLKDALIAMPFVQHSEAIRLMQTITMLLFIVPRASYAKSITSGKIFEYLASRTPILPIGPVDGEVQVILDISNRDTLVDYDNKEGIKRRLLKAFDSWINNGCKLKRIESSDYEAFSRKSQAGQFAELFNDLIGDD